MSRMWLNTFNRNSLLNYTKTQQSPLVKMLIKRNNYKVVNRPDPKLLKMPKKQTTGPPLKTVLAEKIKLSGSISVADYMDAVLTSPSSGYYMNKDVFGPNGDFITSPEISQLFGEMLGIWFFTEWHKLGSPKPLQIIELGPGKGSLLTDLLRTVNRLGLKGKEDVSLHLVEISPTLQSIQANRLCMTHKTSDDKPHYYEGKTISGCPVYWYTDLREVSRGFSWILAHEFFDVLPILKFKKTKDGWREIRIDTDNSYEGKDKDDIKFRFVISPIEPPSIGLLTRPPFSDRNFEDIEISPKSFTIANNISRRVTEDGGICLIADYGHQGSKGDTFRAFKDHIVTDPLIEPGTADLTADVDFEQLKMAFHDNLVFGPVDQSDFLKRCHIEARLKILMENCTPEDKQILQSNYHLLTDADKMGSRFKFLSVFPETVREHLEKYPVLGFSDVIKEKPK